MCKVFLENSVILDVTTHILYSPSVWLFQLYVIGVKGTGRPFFHLELDNVLSIIKVSAAFFFRVRFDLIHRSSKKYCPSLIKTWRYFLLHFWYSRSENCVWKPGDTWLTRNNKFYPTQLFHVKSVLNNNSPWCEHLFLFKFLT